MAVVGGLMRFWSLGRPDQLVFDETYYVKQGVSMLATASRCGCRTR